MIVFASETAAIDLMLAEVNLPQHVVSGDSISIDVVVDAMVFGDTSLTLADRTELQIYTLGDFSKPFVYNDSLS